MDNRPVYSGLWNASANVIAVVTGMTSSIVIVRSLTAGDYGTLSYYLWVASILSALGSLGFPNALNKFTSELRGRSETRTIYSLFRWTLTRVGALNLAVSVILLVVGLTLISENRSLFLLVAGIPLLNVFVAVPAATLSGLEQYRPQAISVFFASIAQLGGVLLSFKLGWGVMGFVSSLVLMQLVQALLLSVQLLRYLSVKAILRAPKTPTNVITPYLAFVIPTTLYHTVFNSVLWNRPEIYFIERFGTVEQVGFYNLAFTIFSMLLFLGWALVNGFYPAISRDYGARNWWNIRSKVEQSALLAVVYATPFTFGALATLDSLINLLYGEKMLPAAQVGSVLFLGLIPGVISGVFGLTISAVRQAWLLVILSSSVAIIKALLILVFTPNMGAMGGAISTSLAASSAFIIQFFVLRHLFRATLPWLRLLGVLAVGFVSTYLLPKGIQGIMPQTGGFVVAVIASAASYIGLLWLLGYPRRILNRVSAPRSTDSLRIVHILGERRLPTVPGEDGMSGIVRAALAIAQAQVALGHEVWVMSIGEQSWSSRWQGVRLISLRPARWANVRIGKHHINLSSHVAFFWFTLRNRFDVIHGHFHNYLRLLRARVRVAHFHGDPYHKGFGSTDLSYKEADFANIARYSDLQVGVTKFVARQLLQGFGDKGRVTHVYNGVDREFFSKEFETRSRSILRQDWGIRDDDVVFLFAGALAWEKGVHHLVNAFLRLAKRFENVHLALAGSNLIWQLSSAVNIPYDDYVKTLRKSLEPGIAEGKVSILGLQPAKDMPAIYSASDVVVMPSIWQEGFGLVALEALATGKPVIASRSGGLPEFVNNDNGILVPRGNELALERAMERLATSPNLRRRLGEAGRESAKAFTWARTAEQLIALYRQVLTAKVSSQRKVRGEYGRDAVESFDA